MSVLSESPSAPWSRASVHGAWGKGYHRLAEYVDGNGHANPPSSYVCDDGFPLGRWSSIQRCHFSNDRLSSGRTALLSGLPGWVWDAHHAKWLRAWFRLAEFAGEHGNASPPSDFVCPDGFRLGSWVSTQRYMMRKNRVAGHRIAMLETLPGWQWGVYDIPPRKTSSKTRLL